MGYLRLRQICLVARRLEPVVADLTAALDIAVGFRDPAVAKYGLENAVMPIGTTFLEVVAPTGPGTAAERYIERRAGDGGYMVILDCDDPAPWRAHLAAIGVRIANPIVYQDYVGLQIHPRDSGGAMLEINHTPGGADPTGPYHPAGKDWRAFVRDARVKGIAGAVLQSTEPDGLARRWGKILGRPIARVGEDCRLALDSGYVRFVADQDGRGEGLGGVDLDVADWSAVEKAARDRGLDVRGGAVEICGTRFRAAR
jgi:hypothetical protein